MSCLNLVIINNNVSVNEFNNYFSFQEVVDRLRILKDGRIKEIHEAIFKNVKYNGDSFNNSISDIIFFTAGFWLMYLVLKP